MKWILAAVGQEVNNLESSAVVIGLESAINRALYGFMKIRLPIHRRKPVLAVLNIYRKVKGQMAAIIVNNRIFAADICINWWVSFAPDFQCWYYCESSCLFYLRFNFVYVSKIMHV